MSCKIERLIRIYNRLRRGPVTVDILHKWTKQTEIIVSPRQLHRDLQELCNLKLNEDEKVVMEELGDKNQKIFKLIFTNNDEEKLDDYDLNTYNLLRNFAPWSIIEARKSSLEKIDTLLYKQISNHKTERTFKTIEHSRSTQFYEYLHFGEVQDKIEEIIWAINNNKQIIIKVWALDMFLFHKQDGQFMDNPKAITSLLINPICLLHHRGEIGFCFTLASTNEFWYFTITQYFTIQLTNNSFCRKEAEDIFETEMSKRFGIHNTIDDKVFDIELQVNPQISNYIKHFFWHKTQEFRMEGDYLIMTMKCGISVELIGWIAMWLDQIKVLQPLELQQKMMEQLLLIQQLYTKNSPASFNSNFYTKF